MAPSSSSFAPLTPELDAFITSNMEAIADCSNLKELQAIERRLHGATQHLMQRLLQVDAAKSKLTDHQDKLIDGIVESLRGSNAQAETARRSVIEQVNVNGGQVVFQNAAEHTAFHHSDVHVTRERRS